MLRKPSHYESTTPRLLQEILGKMVDAINGLESRVEHLEKTEVEQPTIVTPKSKKP